MAAVTAFKSSKNNKVTPDVDSGSLDNWETEDEKCPNEKRSKNKPDELNMDWFLRACREGNTTGISTLTKASQLTAINTCDKNGMSGFSLACATGCMKTVKELLQVSSVDVNQPDNDGNTPLMLASQAGYENIVRFFVFPLRAEVNIDAENKFGFTALMKAALHGRTNCVRMLVMAGADVTKRDWGRGLRADEWAAICGMKETTIAIRNVSRVLLSSEQREELNWDKKTNRLVEYLQRVGCCLKRAFGWGGDSWMNEAGSLYHLASGTANLHSGLAVISLAHRANQPTSLTTSSHKRCIGRNNDIIKDDVIAVESTFSSVNGLFKNQTQKSFDQRCRASSGEKHKKGKTENPAQNVPDIKVVPSVRTVRSPGRTTRFMVPRKDHNYLSVPKKSYKKKHVK
ncbi:unnamed protein product [Clavelina lepadiformis]|uniref:Ankyrin repeat domain-containing protein 33B n=2 Tax=Clavelina lepadiformis TaxID=159417 RepID=A0ABP0F4X7_CLALP